MLVGVERRDRPVVATRARARRQREGGPGGLDARCPVAQRGVRERRVGRDWTRYLYAFGTGDQRSTSGVARIGHRVRRRPVRSACGGVVQRFDQRSRPRPAPGAVALVDPAHAPEVGAVGQRPCRRSRRCWGSGTSRRPGPSTIDSKRGVRRELELVLGRPRTRAHAKDGTASTTACAAGLGWRGAASRRAAAAAVPRGAAPRATSAASARPARSRTASPRSALGRRHAAGDQGAGERARAFRDEWGRIGIMPPGGRGEGRTPARAPRSQPGCASA